MTPNNPTGVRLKTALKAANMTQVSAASAAGIGAQYLNQIIRGVRPMTTAVAASLAPILNVRAGYLLLVDDFPTERDKFVRFIFDEAGSRLDSLPQDFVDDLMHELADFVSWKVHKFVKETGCHDLAEEDDGAD